MSTLIAMRRVIALSLALLCVLVGPPATAKSVSAHVSSRGPWLAFIALVGGLAIAIGLVALWGHGVGPDPTIESSEEEPPAEGVEEPS